MTRAEWLAATSPRPMLSHVKQRATDRRCRLFAAACARRAWQFVKDQRLAKPLHTLEAFADGAATAKRLGTAHGIALGVARGNEDSREACIAWELWQATETTLSPLNLGDSAAASFGWVVHGEGQFDEVKRAERLRQVPLVRDLFRHSRRKVAVRREWLTSSVLALARGIYEEHAFDRIPILADALMDAGCDDAEILPHLRADAPHARGCWAVDLILGKA